jgi:hypothetical protein
VFGPVKPSLVTVVVVRAANEGDGEPDETGTAIITVPVPPGVVGGLVTMFVVERPPFVTVMVVYASDNAAEAAVVVERGTATITVA